jgi:excisionase family DNA binding protein
MMSKKGKFSRRIAIHTRCGTWAWKTGASASLGVRLTASRGRTRRLQAAPRLAEALLYSLESEVAINQAMGTPANSSADVVSILNDVLLRLQRIELALAASPDVKESPSRRETERRRGYTTREVARMLRCSTDSVRTMIRSGRLGAVNMRRVGSGKPRFIVMPEHLAAFIETNKPDVPPKPPRRRGTPSDVIDYFPDTWEAYDQQVDRYPESAKYISRPDGRTCGLRGSIRGEAGNVGADDARVDDRSARATRRGRAQFCPKTWAEYDSLIHRHPGLSIFVLRPDGKKDGPRGLELATE